MDSFAPVRGIIRAAIAEAYDVEDAVNLAAEKFDTLGYPSIPAYEDLELVVLDEIRLIEVESGRRVQ